MPSYQDIESRLRAVEDLLLFIAQTARMRGVVTSGIVGPDGTPTGKQVEGSLLEFYRLHKSNNLPVLAQDAEIVESVNDNG